MKVISATRLNECHKCNWGIKVKSIMTNISHVQRRAGDAVILRMPRTVSFYRAQMAPGHCREQFYFNIQGDVRPGSPMTQAHEEFSRARPGSWLAARRGHRRQPRPGGRPSPHLLHTMFSLRCWDNSGRPGVFPPWNPLSNQTCSLDAFFKK